MDPNSGGQADALCMETNGSPSIVVVAKPNRAWCARQKNRRNRNVYEQKKSKTPCDVKGRANGRSNDTRSRRPVILKIAIELLRMPCLGFYRHWCMYYVCIEWQTAIIRTLYSILSRHLRIMNIHNSNDQERIPEACADRIPSAYCMCILTKYTFTNRTIIQIDNILHIEKLVE